MKILNTTVEQWGLFEASFECGESFANPFTDVSLTAEFVCGKSGKKVNGFYDGNGVWKIRFMAENIGDYQFITSSNIGQLNHIQGGFRAESPAKANHGPVRTAGDRFVYADGAPAYICGTTAYAWWYRPDDVCDKTMASLKKYGFNKVRMLVFPKHLTGMSEIELNHEPPCLPFEGQKNAFDFSKPNVEYFRRLEQKIADLLELGVEADVILFHFYDFGMWGIDGGMSDEAAKLYLGYLLARISAYRNVWWSLANEYDLVFSDRDVRSTPDRRDWDGIGNYLTANDPFGHLRSIHNWGPIYPDRAWMTHVCYQHYNTYSLLLQLKTQYPDKPVIDDEYQYEGNLTYGWGNLNGLQEAQRHMLTFMAGGYATHGECFVVDGNRTDIFWSYGGDMVGESAQRIGYFKKIVETMPFGRMEPDLTRGDGITKFCVRCGYDTLFFLFTPECPVKDRDFSAGYIAGKQRSYKATVYDLWDMKTVQTSTTDTGAFEVKGLIGVKLEQIR
jgi:hypothetical protein